MDAAALKNYREKLLALRAEILAEGDLEIEPGRKDPAAVGSDEDEQPLVEMSQTIASSRNRARSAVLARVSAALARLEEGPQSFGLCTECEEPITEKRLQLMPYVDLCVECQQAADGPRSKGPRKHLRDFR
jgi:DnaK suppressor protein